MAFLVPGMLNSSFGVSIISISDTATIGVLSDETICENPEEFLKFFEDTLKEVIASSGQNV